MTVKACIFDFDGTLADSMWVWTAIGNNFLEKYGIAHYDGFSEELALLGFEAGSKTFVERWDLDVTPAQLVEEWQAQAKESYATNVWLKPHAEEYLRELKAQGVKIAVATAQQRLTLDLALKNEGVYDLFDVTLVCDECTTTGKATPAVYLTAAKMLGESVDDCVVFEDVLGPAKQAHAGGFRVVGVFDDSPAQDHAALEAEVDRFINGYDELVGTDPQQLL
ncbi:MAG: HAD family phosphatase [Coriobacteriia bacterium]|nr:HAD family phosphatase [Coriobacteriia bacterium]